MSSNIRYEYNEIKFNNNYQYNEMKFKKWNVQERTLEMKTKYMEWNKVWWNEIIEDNMRYIISYKNRIRWDGIYSILMVK